MAGRDKTRRFGLVGLFLLQAACILFLAVDVVGDLFGREIHFGVGENHAIEYAVVVALMFGLVFSGMEMRRMIDRQRRIEGQLRAASGAFAEVIDTHFEDWGLTASERDVALLAIKGLAIADIAAIRETRDGTIKAQLNAIYRKAGVSGRPQFISLFIEELMGEGFAPASAPAPVSTP